MKFAIRAIILALLALPVSKFVDDLLGSDDPDNPRKDSPNDDQ